MKIVDGSKSDGIGKMDEPMEKETVRRQGKGSLMLH